MPTHMEEDGTECMGVTVSEEESLMRVRGGSSWMESDGDDGIEDDVGEEDMGVEEREDAGCWIDGIEDDVGEEDMGVKEREDAGCWIDGIEDDVGKEDMGVEEREDTGCWINGSDSDSVKLKSWMTAPMEWSATRNGWNCGRPRSRCSSRE
jgi:hypothetical protein